MKATHNGRKQLAHDYTKFSSNPMLKPSISLHNPIHRVMIDQLTKLEVMEYKDKFVT